MAMASISAWLRCLVACALAAAVPGRLLRRAIVEQSWTVARLYPFYHTTQQIHDELAALATRCPALTLHAAHGTGADGSQRTIDVATVRAPGAQPVNRNFMLFGEHSRELISAESGLHFIKTLCGETSLSPRAQGILRTNEFQIVVNGNPESRKRVEQGNYCLRTNPNGVDLNRNWDEGWQAKAPLEPRETNPGPSPFSEAETRIFKQLVSTYNPTTFLTVHSGTKGMYMPWAFDMHHLANRNQPQMLQILREIDSNHCQCPFGAAGREVGYPCPGTCLDWVYDRLQTDYAFAFEIYGDPSQDAALKQRWQEKIAAGGSFFQEHSHLGHEHFRDLFVEHPSSFVQLRKQDKQNQLESEASAYQCFQSFNPTTQHEFDSVVENWSDAYLDVAEKVAARLASGSSGAAHWSLAANASNSTAVLASPPRGMPPLPAAQRQTRNASGAGSPEAN